MIRIQYRCRGCSLEFPDAKSANAHHDATGHHQTFRCPSCGSPLSAHSDGAYVQCMEGGPVTPFSVASPNGDRE